MGLEELGEHKLDVLLKLLRHRPRNAVPTLGRTRVQVIDRVQVVVFVVPAEGTRWCEAPGGWRGGGGYSLRAPG